jgi:hypothetical protein
VDQIYFSTAMPSATAGTIAEYDMILSISKDAIEAQFLLLYNTPSDPNDEDSERLISKNLKLGYKFVDRFSKRFHPVLTNSVGGMTVTKKSMSPIAKASRVSLNVPPSKSMNSAMEELNIVASA